MLAAAYLINRTPAKLVNFKTPYEALFGVAPSYTHLRSLRVYVLHILITSPVINLIQEPPSVYF